MKNSIPSQIRPVLHEGDTMAPSHSPWHITPDAGNDQAYPILAQDPVWNSFALTDLEPPMREYSQFAIASHEDGDKHASCLIVRHPIIGQVLSPMAKRKA